MEQLRRMRSRLPLLGVALVLAGVAAGAGSVAWAAKGGDARGPAVKSAFTLTFTADGVRRDLVKIGTSTVWAACEPGQGMMGRRMHLEAGPQGAVIATENASEEVPPNTSSNHFIGPGLIEAPSGVQAEHESFAVFDGGGTSVSGTHGLMTDVPNNRCTATIQIAG